MLYLWNIENEEKEKTNFVLIELKMIRENMMSTH